MYHSKINQFVNSLRVHRGTQAYACFFHLHSHIIHSEIKGKIEKKKKKEKSCLPVLTNEIGVPGSKPEFTGFFLGPFPILPILTDG